MEKKHWKLVENETSHFIGDACQDFWLLRPPVGPYFVLSKNKYETLMTDGGSLTYQSALVECWGTANGTSKTTSSDSEPAVFLKGSDAKILERVLQTLLPLQSSSQRIVGYHVLPSESQRPDRLFYLCVQLAQAASGRSRLNTPWLSSTRQWSAWPVERGRIRFKWLTLLNPHCWRLSKHSHEMSDKQVWGGRGISVTLSTKC